MEVSCTPAHSPFFILLHPSYDRTFGLRCWYPPYPKVDCEGKSYPEFHAQRTDEVEGLLSQKFGRGARNKSIDQPIKVDCAPATRVIAPQPAADDSSHQRISAWFAGASSQARFVRYGRKIGSLDPANDFSPPWIPIPESPEYAIHACGWMDSIRRGGRRY